MTSVTTTPTIIRPHEGAQTAALASRATIVLFGGAKGGGKSHAMRLVPVRYINTPGYRAAIFRRSLPQIENPGGQWDKSYEIYKPFAGKAHNAKFTWRFPPGSSIRFWHLQNDDAWLDWQGTECAYFGFDQLEEFTQTQFLKMLTCLRTTTKVPTKVFATMNPDAVSWVRLLVDPWIASDGYVDPLQDRKTKYFTVIDDVITWVSPDYRDSNGQPPTSCVYISADVWDNPTLLENDPKYLSNLMSQCKVDRDRFLGVRGRGGNWNVKAEAGKVFKSDWFRIIDHAYADQVVKRCRYWDLAASEAEHKGDNPDWTVGLLMALLRNGSVVVEDLQRDRLTPPDVDKLMLRTAQADGSAVLQRWERAPGEAGIRSDFAFRNLLTGYNCAGILPRISKFDRAKPLSRLAEDGRFYLKQADWNNTLINEYVSFPDGDFDDQVDGGSGAYSCLVNNSSSGTGQMQI